MRQALPPMKLTPMKLPRAHAQRVLVPGNWHLVFNQIKTGTDRSQGYHSEYSVRKRDLPVK